jgi:hypothetical protein
MPLRWRSLIVERANPAKPHNGQHQVCHGGLLPGEDQVFSTNQPSTPLCKGLDDRSQVVRVSCGSVHAVHHDGVAVAGKVGQFGQLGPIGVPARDLVCKHPSRGLTLELAPLALVQGARARTQDPCSKFVPFLSVLRLQRCGSGTWR